MVMYAEFYHHHHLPLSGTLEFIGGYFKRSGRFSRLSLPLLTFFQLAEPLNPETRHC